MNAWMGTRAMLLEGASWSGRERNRVFQNLGDWRFVDVSGISGADSLGDGRSVVPVDWDGDGRLDLFLKSRTAPRLQFFHNRVTGAGRFLEIELEGHGLNRDEIGARVRVEVAGRAITRTLHAGDGYLAQTPKRLWFGVGDAEHARVFVRWADGARDVYPDLATERRHRLRRGGGSVELVRPTLALAARPAEESPASLGRRVRVPLVERIPLASLAVPSYEDDERTLASFAGRPVLLELWSRDCAACLAELGELHGRREELASTGLVVVPLCVDADDPTGARARGRLERFELAGVAGPCDEGLLAVVEALLREVLGEVEETPLPLSLLLDDGGRLAALYLGRVEADLLLRDARRLGSQDRADRRYLLRGVRLFADRRDPDAVAAALSGPPGD